MDVAVVVLWSGYAGGREGETQRAGSVGQNCRFWFLVIVVVEDENTAAETSFLFGTMVSMEREVRRSENMRKSKPREGEEPWVGSATAA